MKTIVLLDDDQFILDKLKDDILNVEPDTNVLTFTNGMECLKQFDSELKEINLNVVTDLNMDPINGDEFIIELRKKETKVQKIFVVTSSKDITKMQKILSLNIDGYILKPWSNDKINRIIE